MFPIISTFSKTNSIRLIICILSFFVFNTTFSQQKNTIIEDDYEILKGKIRLYFNASTDRAIIYAEQMAKSSNFEDLAFANGALSCLLESKGETEKSREKYKKALAYLAKIPDSNEKKQLTADVYNYGGLAEWYRGNHNAALEIFQAGIKFSSQLGDVKQIIKFKANIALLNESVGNYQLAIKNNREIIDFIDKNESLFPNIEITNRRCNVYLGLGNGYEAYFVDKQRMEILDSSAYFYKKSIEYGDAFPHSVANSKLSLGNISSWKKEYQNAEKLYLQVASLSLKNKYLDLLSKAYYNLGDIYRSIGKFPKALSFYRKSDSLEVLYHLDESTYLKSNCYQARIYNDLNMPELAHKHSEIYLDLFDKVENKLNEERSKVNYKQGEDNLTAEMLSIEKKYKEDVFLNRILNVFYVTFFIAVVFFLIKNIRDKRKTRKKLVDLIADLHLTEGCENQYKKEIVFAKTEKRKSKEKSIYFFLFFIMLSGMFF